MRLQSVSAATGAAWVKQGFRIFARQPLAFSGMFAAFLFAVFLLTLLPLVGSLLLLALLPLGSLGFMIGTRDALQDRVPLPRAFITPLRQGPQKLRAMIVLGLIYAAASVLIITLAEWADGGALDELMQVLAEGKATPADVAERLADARLTTGLMIRFGLAGLLSVPFWHAPALVHWGTQGVAQSLFSSTVAIWRNKGAFSVYALAWTGLVVGFGVGALLLFGLLGMPQLAAFALMPATLLFSTVFYVSLWFTFADCFGTARGDDPSSDHPITKDTP